MNILDEVVQNYSSKTKKLDKSINFLPFESSELKRLDKIGRYEANIDMSFLKMRKDNGLPMFAIYTKDSDCCYFDIEFSDVNIVNIRTNIPNKLLKHYKSFMIDYCKDSQHIPAEYLYCLGSATNITYKISSKFEGVLDDKARNLMSNAACNNCVRLLICEASNWNLVKEQFNPDPLIIDYYPDINYGKLIYKFDMTSVESYIGKEFSL